MKQLAYGIEGRKWVLASHGANPWGCPWIRACLRRAAAHTVTGGSGATWIVLEVWSWHKDVYAQCTYMQTHTYEHYNMQICFLISRLVKLLTVSQENIHRRSRRSRKALERFECYFHPSRKDRNINERFSFTILNTIIFTKFFFQSFEKQRSKFASKCHIKGKI